MYIFNIKIGLVIMHVWYNFASNKNYLEIRAETNTAFACSNSHLLNERIVEYLIKIN